ncbi:MAG: translation initiation factor IF-3 [Eubacterium sp.]|nr:translation initiation factor IF-3 [Eubacterium sp.]MCM1418584.1 translation initiation factor IF-3 [Roseburia sp.]
MCIISAKELLINEEIREKEVRVIGADGEQLGVMPTREALSRAEQSDLDLVLIAPQGNPPVCRIMDYGKYRFEQSKREKESRKNQKQAELKEIQMSLNIDTNDFNTKANQAIKFLKNGDKVRIKVRFRRARELSHMNLGEDLMKRFLDACAEYGASEKPAKLEGRNYMTVLAPKAAIAAAKKAKTSVGQQAAQSNKED